MGKEQLSYGILAGGQSRRMGMDKASLKLEEQTFLNQLTAEFSDKGPFMISVRDKKQGQESGQPYLVDKNRGIGPIEGLKNLLEWSPTDYIFICACDMPFLKYDLVEYMAGYLPLGYDCYVMEDAERIHPLCAIYSKTMAVMAKQMIGEQNYRLMHFLGQHKVKKIDIRQSDFPAVYLQNVNTKEEYLSCLHARDIMNAMSRVRVFDNAGEKTRRELAQRGSLIELKKGKVLFRDKEQVSTLYMVVSGFVSLYKLDEQGERKVIFVLGEGKLVNEVILQDLPASINCEIFEQARILSFPRNDFLKAMEGDFGLTRAVLDSLSIKVRRLYRQMKNTSGSLRGDKKLAAKLWKLSGDFGKPVDGAVMIDMEISITYLADMLGTKRETVSRQLKMLVEKGLVKMADSHFIIPDRDALANYFKLS